MYSKSWETVMSLVNIKQIYSYIIKIIDNFSYKKNFTPIFFQSNHFK